MDMYLCENILAISLIQRSTNLRWYGLGLVTEALLRKRRMWCRLELRVTLRPAFNLLVAVASLIPSTVMASVVCWSV